MIRLTTALALASLLVLPARLPAAEKKLPPWEKPVKVGRYVFLENCSVCHEVNKPDSKKAGPVLYRVFEQETMASGIEPSEAYIKAKVMVGGGIMPPFAEKLTEEEIDKIILFLRSRK